MDVNDPYIDHEEEYIGPGSSHLQEHGVPHGDGGLKQVMEEENDQNEELFVDGIVEDGAYIQGDDGQYYVMVNDGQGSRLELVQMDPDGTEETIYVGNEEEYPTGSDNKVGLVGGLDRRAKVEEDDEDDDLGDEDESQQAIMIESIPQGLKSRKNRQYGNCRCPECGTSFVNSARLERHLAVHQVFGSFLCPLCGKTFKYEYNLFYHWRKTCRDLNELVPLEERMTMDVNAVRQLVDDIAQKKVEIGPIDIGVSKGLLFQSGPLSRLEMPQNPLGRRGNACRACGVVVPANHMPRHLALHRNEGHKPDDLSIAGGYFCDLCGLAFRHHFNLIKHWRTSCPEIQANIPDDVELTMDDEQIRSLVGELMRKAVTMQQGPKNVNVSRATFHNGMNHEGDPSADPNHQLADEGDVVVDDYGPSTSNRNSAWHDPRDSAIVFADDFGDEDEMMVVGEDGQVNVASSNATNWKYTATGEQCKECFRSFANRGRLERHMAGFHAHFGAHHCLLCGNRFKYEYNLLYHYRRSCPYTKSFIDRDVREQMDATSLRKLVRGLAQKEMRVQPTFKSETVRLMNLRRPSTFNDQRCQKELKLAKAPSQVPRQLLTARPGIPDARPCPICSVIFYGRTAMDRHIQAAHGMEPNDVRAIQQADNETMMDIEKEGGQPIEEGLGEEFPIEDEEEDLEPPPLLEREEPIPEAQLSMQPVPVHIRFVDHMGTEVEELGGVHHQELKTMIEQGSLAVNDQLVIIVDGVEVCYYVNELINAEDGKYAVFMQGEMMNGFTEGEKPVDLPPAQMQEPKPNELAFDDNILDEPAQ